MCFSYDSDNEFESARVARARKPAKCASCRSAINPGDQYHAHSGKCDGNFFYIKTCRRCQYDILRVAQHELDEGCHWSEAWPPIDELEDYLHDSGLGQTPTEDVPADYQIGQLPVKPAKAG